MKFFNTSIGFLLSILSCVAGAEELLPYTKQWDVKLQRLPPSQVLTKLDLDRPGLEAVKAAAVKGDQPRALAELLRYYRGKFPPPSADRIATQTKFAVADGICRHVFQWGPYKSADYGTNIDWTINPADDIEWVAVVYRFYWADDLARAYTATRDDKYARAFVELTTDWIAKHPLDDWTRTHPTLTHWKGFAWLDLQTGVRASKAVAAFKAMLHSDAVTPEFLAVFLASMYDHQHKTELIPMGMVHNKAIFEQSGVLNICHTFPEFRETTRWAKLAVERTQENLLKQTTPEAIQREWCGSYHLAVLRDGLEVLEKASQLGIPVSDEFRQRVRGMCDYVFAIATPDLGFPMFGDTARKAPEDGKTPQLYDPLLRYSEVWNDPKYAARAKLDVAALPKQTSYAFESAGVYVMRSQWGLEGTYLAMQCAPPALSGHDQPDNSTFELYALGRWLMTDTGYYTYGHNRTARAWHRQTRVHQTLTLDGKDSKTAGRLRLWHSSPELDAVVVHRRSVWFVDKKFFVILDEAIGNAKGELALHWTPAPGTGRFNSDRTSFTMQFPDANVLIQAAAPQRAKFEEEDGWFAWDYNQRVPRKMLNVKHSAAAPARFLTVIAPYRGTNAPVVEAKLVGKSEVGSDKVQISVRAFGKQWSFGRDLEKKTAW
jgi:heparan-sulfate lyase